MIHLMVWFGEWATWREYPTQEEANNGLRYWQERTSWPLRLEKKD